jgi:ABC-2 type transport system ATP-binding protein
LIPTSGELKVFDKEVFRNKRFIFENTGILSDNSGLYERLSVWDNMVLFSDIKGLTKKNVTDILEKVGLGDTLKIEAGKLSRGMKQRLMIARAVLHKPRLLFLDEPTASLDPGNSLEIHKLLRTLNEEGTTIFLTTHNMEEADKLCDRVAFLNEGEIVEIGNPEELKMKYQSDEIKIILKDSYDVLMLKKTPDIGLKISKWIEKDQLLSIHSMEPNLEKIFLNLTGREL